MTRQNAHVPAGMLFLMLAAPLASQCAAGNIVGRDIGSSAGFGVLSINDGYRFGSALQLTAGIRQLA